MIVGQEIAVLRDDHSAAGGLPCDLLHKEVGRLHLCIDGYHRIGDGVDHLRNGHRAGGALSRGAHRRYGGGRFRLCGRSLSTAPEGKGEKSAAQPRRAGNHQAGTEQGSGFQDAAGSLRTVCGGLFPDRNGLGDCGRFFADFIFILIWIHHSFLLKFLL